MSERRGMMMMFDLHAKTVKRILFILVIGVACSLPSIRRQLVVFLEQQQQAGDWRISSGAQLSVTVLKNHSISSNSNNNHTTNTINSNKISPEFWKRHADIDCFTPLPEPVLGTHDLSRIINVGMPKVGSSSIQAYFRHSYGISKARHFHCGRAGNCGKCIRRAVRNGQPPLVSCGNFTVYSQIDQLTNNRGLCNFPQVLYLEQIYQENPHATFLLPMRNISAWYRSLAHWTAHGRATLMTHRFQKCALPMLNFTAQMGSKEQDYAMLMCNHVRHVRQFVRQHPTLTLIEFQLENNDTGALLERLFPGTFARYWGQSNVQTKFHRGND